MAHISPQFIGFHPLDLLRAGGGQRLALHRFAHPIHHRVMAHADQPLRGPQPHSLKVVRQRGLPLGGFHPAMVPLPKGLPARPAEPALPPMAAAPVLDHFFTGTLLAFHPNTIASFYS